MFICCYFIRPDHSIQIHTFLLDCTTQSTTYQPKFRELSFQLSFDINYEDTDAGGVVYYGNYLAYMERARNAYLRSLGSLKTLFNQYHLIFVVSTANLKYHSPAFLDDKLTVSVQVNQIKGATILFNQRACRETQCLVSGQINVVTMNGQSRRPIRVPKVLLDKLNKNPNTISI